MHILSLLVVTYRGKVSVALFIQFNTTSLSEKYSVSWRFGRSRSFSICIVAFARASAAHNSALGMDSMPLTIAPRGMTIEFPATNATSMLPVSNSVLK